MLCFCQRNSAHNYNCYIYYPITSSFSSADNEAVNDLEDVFFDDKNQIYH